MHSSSLRISFALSSSAVHFDNENAVSRRLRDSSFFTHELDRPIKLSGHDRVMAQPNVVRRSMRETSCLTAFAFSIDLKTTTKSFSTRPAPRSSKVDLMGNPGWRGRSYHTLRSARRGRTVPAFRGCAPYLAGVSLPHS